MVPEVPYWWMDVGRYLARESEGGQKPVTQIEFEGEEMTVASVLAWRARMLAG